MAKGTVFSIYFPNVSASVIDAQRSCVERFLPKDWTFTQFKYTPEQLEQTPHANALAKCVESNENDFTMFLDIDCIPLCERAFTLLEWWVMEFTDGRGLAGCAQRANHLQNNAHLYIGPFCMAFSKKYYKELGSPSFSETLRGDAGEEITYRWQERTKYALIHPRLTSDVLTLWPFSCNKPIWELDFGFQFGFGTTYGSTEELVYHQFNIRTPEMHKAFVDKCEEVLKLKNERILV